MCLLGSEAAVAGEIGMLLGWVRCHLRGLDGLVEIPGASSHRAWQCPRAGIQSTEEKGSKRLAQNNIWAGCSLNHGMLGVF